ncbi:hypothetical protein B9Z19DRAFT_1068940 [Tuber borchii]|uniref:Uncharacterized protein n=1 Tax=Tuber borchii TaxID=42251 RepID=A0A2T6ZDD0_TUBBO|nr:hypothetical protein B9Z19DRAFT_1068940 [Tuber borchii]
MRDSTLQFASFEKTTDHLFEAGFHMKRNAAEVVSERIILCQSMSIGMGALKVFRRHMSDPHDLVAKRLVFQEAYAKMFRHPIEKLGHGMRFLRPPSFFWFGEF